MPRLAVIAPLPLLLALSAAGPVMVIQPGKWQTTVEILEMKMPGAPPGVTAALNSHKPMTTVTCVTPEMATRGPQNMMNRDKACRFAKYSMAGGQIASDMTCTRPTGTMHVVSAGTYTAFSYSVIGHATSTGRMSMTMTTRTSGRRLGSC